MIVAVTGGTGFIGSSLVEQLVNEGHEVRVLTRDKSYSKKGVETILGDICAEKTDLISFVRNVDVLYNCSGAVREPRLMKRVHVDGTRKLLEFAKGNVNRWVQLSSVGVYGRCMKGTVNEETQQNPQGEYECTKATSDYLVETSGIPFSILRPSIVFGEGMVNQSFLQFANAISTGRFFFIGKRGALLNYIHVNDVARALQLCGTQNEALGNDFIISETIDIEQFVQIVQKVTKSIQRVHRLPKIPIRAVAACIGWTGLIPLTASRVDALTRRSVYDSSKIQGQLGFEFKPTLEERIKSFVFNNK